MHRGNTTNPHQQQPQEQSCYIFMGNTSCPTLISTNRGITASLSGASQKHPLSDTNFFSSLAFLYYDRTLGKGNLERKGFAVHHGSKPELDLKSRIWLQELKQSYGENCLLPCSLMACSSCFLIQPRTLCPWYRHSHGLNSSTSIINLKKYPI